jgi:hypothetical protein
LADAFYPKRLDASELNVLKAATAVLLQLKNEYQYGSWQRYAKAQAVEHGEIITWAKLL